MITVVTVAAISPLTIRERAATTALPAKVPTGVAYTPSIGDQVLASFVANVWWILGGCA